MIDYHGLDIDKCYISGCQCGKPKADDLRTRIAAVQQAHTIRLDYSHPRFGDCRCGFKTGAQDRDGEDFDEPWWELHASHVADAVIRELTNPIRGCTDPWHWSTGEPYRCPSCGYWMGEGYV